MDVAKIDEYYDLFDAILLKAVEHLTFEEIDCVISRINAKLLQGKFESYLAFRSEESSSSNSMYT